LEYGDPTGEVDNGRGTRCYPIPVDAKRETREHSQAGCMEQM